MTLNNLKLIRRKRGVRKTLSIISLNPLTMCSPILNFCFPFRYEIGQFSQFPEMKKLIALVPILYFTLHLESSLFESTFSSSIRFSSVLTFFAWIFVCFTLTTLNQLSFYGLNLVGYYVFFIFSSYRLIWTLFWVDCRAYSEVFSSYSN